MSFSVRTLEDGSYEIVFEKEPAYCRSLTMSPAEIEPELLEGSWLVLLFAIWSVADRTAIEEALSVAKMFDGKVQLGVRPFDRHEEIGRWAKGVKEKWGSPICSIANKIDMRW